MERFFIANLIYIHKPAICERIKKILEGKLPEAEHFVVLGKGSGWADKVNPGEEVQIAFGYSGDPDLASAYTRVLATEKIPLGAVTEEHARLNLGTADRKTIIEKQFCYCDGARVDFVSVLHLARKGGWKHRRQSGAEAPAPRETAVVGATKPLRLADGPLQALLGPRAHPAETVQEESRNPNEHPD